MDKSSSKISIHTKKCIQQSHIRHCILTKNSPLTFRFQCLLKIRAIFLYRLVSRYQNVQGFETCNVNIKSASVSVFMTQQNTNKNSTNLMATLKLRLIVACKILFLYIYIYKLNLLPKHFIGKLRRRKEKILCNKLRQSLIIISVNYSSLLYCIVGVSNVNHRFNVFQNTTDNLIPNQN